MKNSYLNIKQPRFDLTDSLFAIRHLPHGDVQGAMRQETLVCGIVLALKHAYIEDINNTAARTYEFYFRVVKTIFCERGSD